MASDEPLFFDFDQLVHDMFDRLVYRRWLLKTSAGWQPPIDIHETPDAFVVDGEWQDDPLCHERVPNGFGSENCILHVLREETQEERIKVVEEQLA